MSFQDTIVDWLSGKMYVRIYLLQFFGIAFLSVSSSPETELVVRILGGPLVAQLLAEENGHFYKGPVLGFADTYILIPIEGTFENHQKRGLQSKKIVTDDRVIWADMQEAKTRQKRDYISFHIDPADIPKERQKRFEINKNMSLSNDTSKLRKKRYSGTPEEIIKRYETVRKSYKRPPASSESFDDNFWKHQSEYVFNVPKRTIKSDEEVRKISNRPSIASTDKTFNDELWTQQWYLRDTRSRLDLPKLDLNVLPVYRAGITGKGIRISILDDGIEYTHDDLKGNYDPDISWDCNEDDDDPFPRYDYTKSNSHGTRCAGEVAMYANNGKCGVGIAYNAKIGGVKMLDGLVTDRIEGTALSYAQHLVDIYSASWGPNDDGKTVDGPGRLASEAIKRGIEEGRKGRGTIYVWASGNGGNNNDNCNCDGYLASPYTVSIGSASQKGEFPWYGEACASTLAVTYSSGAYKDQMITTTDLNNACTTKHTGTSASAPLAAGIIALALEANANLTWRDVQHLIVWTSELAPLVNNQGWQQNAAGFWFNDRFGFGLMNSFGLISAALTWTNVPEWKTCETLVPSKSINSTLTGEHPVEIFIPTTGCKGSDQEIRYLEHVEVRVNIQFSIRGALQVHLVSPSGTQLKLLAPRKLDQSDKGFKDWTFLSVMTWGEPAEGVWTLVVSDATKNERNFGSIGDTTLILHGTTELPFHMKKGARSYNENYNRIQSRVKTPHQSFVEKEVYIPNNDVGGAPGDSWKNEYFPYQFFNKRNVYH
ncbi:unnamed protein product [Phaedon cochleariae]|uniref:furin n=1 Tax=Phaedon cochleariae TaxID=80249 RepID=A0A9P0DAQ6_PHACE|nr:unnamed protein product [Phaedon cochleariae]